ncbi:MAG: hypothetical protein U5J83_04325 [Bryobacterales bacterium]|nr:hypothetical protein [Bryobacterales bacterium]
MRTLFFGFLLAGGLGAQVPAAQSETQARSDAAHAASSPTESPAEPEAGGDAAEAAKATPEAAASGGVQRTSLNLLGQVNSAKGEARRNENVQIDLIDNNVLKELNQRLGVTATIVTAFPANQNFFGAEFGGSPTGQPHLAAGGQQAPHGSVFFVHDNSVLRARAFFQVGDVQPARDNSYGFNVVLPAWKNAFLTVEGSQQKLRGQVNGNVLIPLPEERSPLARDPATALRVAEMMSKFPNLLPNRTDINVRMLNTNAPQNIDNDTLSALIDQRLGERDTLRLRYRALLQDVDAFQLVSGQNPNTMTKSHDARVTWIRAITPASIWESTLRFDRVGSLLTADETAFGPRVTSASLFQELGPGSNIPIDRAVNQFHYATQLRQTTGRHNWYAGGTFVRYQLNGTESDALRGNYSFTADFGRSAIDNLLMGAPSNFTLQLGNATRGYRGWMGQAFVGDKWQLSQNLSIDMGLRFAPMAAPNEVNGFDEIPFDTDWNNVAPRVGIAYRLPGRSGLLRGAFGVDFGEFFPATYGQVRFNPPASLKVRVLAPDFLDPLRDLTPADFAPGARAEVYFLDPNLATPYSAQYNLSWEREVAGGARLRLGYVGSRSHKLLSTWFLNRGQPREGIPLNTATTNERRADQRFYDLRYPTNASRGYYDAARATLLLPRWRGLSLEGSYWFSKAIDLGGNYTNTGSGKDGLDSRGQTEFDVQGDMRALSDFDQPHSFMLQGGYAGPTLRSLGRFWSQTLGGWSLNSVALWKTGTPFTIFSGSDGPGFGNVDGSFNDRPDIVDASVLGRTVNHPDRSLGLLPRAAFDYMPLGAARGNIGRNTFRRDNVWNLNASLSKTWQIHQERNLTLRAESLNLLNTPQFAEPGSRLTNPDFGQITNTLNDGRTFRFQARLTF